MNRIRCAMAAAALVACWSTTGFGQEFSRFVVFGDSLSDAGTLRASFPPGGGKFTTNPGPVWTEIVSDRLGVNGLPANAGGSNFATGGARVSQLPGVPPIAPTATATPVVQQVSAFLQGGPADPNALYSVWAGGNDFFVQAGLLGAGAISPTEAAGNLQIAADELVRQVARLQAAGAQQIIVWNLPDAGKTPGALMAGPVAIAVASQLTDVYSQALSAGIAALPGDIIGLNGRLLLNEMVADPAAFGLRNVTSMACTSVAPDGTIRSPYCTPSTLVSADAAITYLWADASHPTSAGHRVLGDYATSVLQAPGKIGMLPQAPLQAYDQLFRSLDQRMRSSMGAARAGGGISVYAIYDYAPWELDAGSLRSPGTDLTGNSLLVGADMPIGPVLAGLAFGYAQSEADFANNGGGFELNEWSMTAYAGALVGSAGFVSGSVTVGDLDYRDVHRHIALFDARRTESADAGGTHLGATLLGGWLFRGAPVTHGPIARLSWQSVKVDAFAERSNTSTAMRFDSQDVSSLVGSLGWHANTALTAGGVAVRPYGRLAWETEMRQDDRNLRAGLLRMPGSFALPVYRPDDSWFAGEIGVAADFANNLTGFIGYTFQLDRSDGTFQAITAGIRMAL